MEEMTVKNSAYPALLDGYVKQGQMFLMNAAQNLIQYGRVLTEAKPLVPHGKFGEWVQSNFNMSERSAQGYMAVWRRFGENEALNRIQFSNLQKMLALPDGREEEFARENDIESMTARQVAEAVRKVRQEEQEKRSKLLTDTQAQLRKERAAREEAERRAEGSADQSDEIRTLEQRILEQERENASLSDALESARRDLEDTETMLAESQQEYDRVRGELLNSKSAAARGDAERTISEQLTVDDFAGAVRIFLGSAAQMPYMGGTFAEMTDAFEIRQWDELLQAVEDFALRARRALNTVETEAVIDG